MSKSSTDWANLDSAYERLVSAAVPLDRLASAAGPVMAPPSVPSRTAEPEPSAGSAERQASESEPRGSRPAAGPATGIEPRPAGESRPGRAAGSTLARPPGCHGLPCPPGDAIAAPRRQQRWRPLPPARWPFR